MMFDEILFDKPTTKSGKERRSVSSPCHSSLLSTYFRESNSISNYSDFSSIKRPIALMTLNVSQLNRFSRPLYKSSNIVKKIWHIISLFYPI